MTRFLRFTFVVYAIALFMATHWPGAAVPGADLRADLFIHAGVFGLWNVLFALTGWVGPRLSRRNVVISSFVATLVGIGDELSQSLPVFDRTFGFDDMTANLVGVLIAAIAMGLFVAKSSRLRAGAGQSKGKV